MKPSRNDIAEGTATLRASGWLAGTAADFQDAILTSSQWHWFAPGSAISHGGDTSGGMFGTAQGTISIVPAIGVADAPIAHIAVAPFWFGSNPVVSGLPRTVSVVARAQCLVALVPQHALMTLFAEQPERWRYLATAVNEIAMLAQQMATDLLIRDSQSRCIAVLLRVADCRKAGDAPVVALMTQDELAAMANMSRQTIGPILRRLADAGMITMGYRNIVLHDPPALRAMIAA